MQTRTRSQSLRDFAEERVQRRMPSLIWNPFFGHYIPTHQAKTSEQSHDIVLDLTTEKRSRDLVKKEPFDFSKFYKTYQQIASREPPVSRNRKRQLSTESSDSDQSIIQETKKPRTEENLYDNSNSFSSNSLLKGQSSRQQEHLTRGTRGQKEQKIASIRDSCDCRFCYEDHIIKMRLKRSKPWLNV